MDLSKIRSFGMVGVQLILEFVLERTFVSTYLDYGSLILNNFVEQILYTYFIYPNSIFNRF